MCLFSICSMVAEIFASFSSEFVLEWSHPLFSAHQPVFECFCFFCKKIYLNRTNIFRRAPELQFKKTKVTLPICYLSFYFYNAVVCERKLQKHINMKCIKCKMQFVNTLNKRHFYVWSTGVHLLFITFKESWARATSSFNQLIDNAWAVLLQAPALFFNATVALITNNHLIFYTEISLLIASLHSFG